MAIKGAILGDIIGSQYEFKRPEDFDNKTALLLTEKCGFTDDTVLSLAVKYAIKNKTTFVDAFDMIGNLYRNRGYGMRFSEWLDSDIKQPYNSYGNGSAMRVSYIADHYDKLNKVTKVAKLSAECTHNHPEGIKGAIVTATCIWMAKHGYSKDDILKYGIEQYPKDKYIYSPEFTLDEIRNKYTWNETCQGSVPAVIRCIYEANNYTEFIRNVFSLKCDTDTLCAIGGGIAEELFDNKFDEILPFADKVLQMYLDNFLLDILNN